MKLKCMVVITMLMFISVSVAVTDDCSDAAYNTSFYVGQYLNGNTNTSLIIDVAPGYAVVGSIPGMTIMGLISLGNRPCIRMMGTFTTAGEYTLQVVDSSKNVLENVKVTVYTRSTSVELSAPSEAYAGTEFTVTAKVKPDDATYKEVNWTVDGATMISSRVDNGICYGVFKSTTVGICTVTATPSDGNTGAEGSTTISIKDPTHTERLIFDSNGGSGSPATMTNTATTDSDTVFTIPKTVPTRTLHTFIGWSTDKDSGKPQYAPGSEITVKRSSTLTLYAVWSENKITVESCDAPSATVSGREVSFSVGSSVSGCSISISGADWLKVDENTIHGKAGTTGTYSISITLYKDNYPSVTFTKTITVVSSLNYSSVPSDGTSIWR